MTHELEALAGSLPHLHETLATVTAEREQAAAHLASLDEAVASVVKRVTDAEIAAKKIKAPLPSKPKVDPKAKKEKATK